MVKCRRGIGINEIEFSVFSSDSQEWVVLNDCDIEYMHDFPVYGDDKCFLGMKLGT